MLLAACAPSHSASRRTARVPANATRPVHVATTSVAPTESSTAAETDTEEPIVNLLDEQYGDVAAVDTQEGVASYYHDSLAGNLTANGERYRLNAFTCAHRVLPFGTVVRVTRLDGSERSVVVRVNDRGPFGSRSRIIDLSKAAARSIGLIRDGIARVRLDILEMGDGARGDENHQPRRRRRRR